jgi:hypothetical protein
MEMIAGAALVCLAATLTIWVNDRLPPDPNEDKLLDIPSHESI